MRSCCEGLLACLALQVGNMTLLDLPAHALEGVARALPGNARKPLRATCHELRAAANASTDFVRIDLGDKLHAEGSAGLLSHHTQPSVTLLHTP